MTQSSLLRSGGNFHLFPASVVFVFLLLASPCKFAQAQESPDHKPPASRKMLPFDPLTSQEKAAAERIALEDSRVKELLGNARRRLVSVELFMGKPEKIEPSPEPVPLTRSAEVVFFRLEGEYGVRAVVDLGRKAVTEVTRLASEEVALTEEDLAEAYQLSLRNDEVRKALGEKAENYRVTESRSANGPPGEQYIVRGLPVRATIESDPCWKHRCLQLLFRHDDVYLTQPIVVVDLSAHQVYLERRQQ
jgi:hypothetical protein